MGCFRDRMGRYGMYPAGFKLVFTAQTLLQPIVSIDSPERHTRETACSYSGLMGVLRGGGRVVQTPPPQEWSPESLIQRKNLRKKSKSDFDIEILG